MNLIFSSRNRSACVRIPVSGASARTKRIEFRTPDPSCNPYLGFAAVLMAGIDGVRTRIEPPAPVDEDLYRLVETNPGLSIGSTQGSLEEALQALEKGHEFLVQYGVFTPDVIEAWVETKREAEIDFIRLLPHPKEFSLYFNV